MRGKSQTFHRQLDAARRKRGVALMGVCNVTPDSFSDGGKHLAFDDACARVDELVREGADFIDIGAESTRPGAHPVAPQEQLARMLDVVRYGASHAVVSVDTTSPEVAELCLSVGAVAVNDVSCLADARLAEVAAAAGATLILMHSRGPQVLMRGFSEYPESGYGDVVSDVVREWNVAAARAIEQGMLRDALVMDPGLGFAKSARQSTDLLRRTDELAARSGAPVLVGASRKSFLSQVEPGVEPRERLGASLAAALYAAHHGASLLRVHDVRATRQAIDMARLLHASDRAGLTPAGGGQWEQRAPGTAPEITGGPHE